MHILLTKRLTLRPPSVLDADDVALWLSNWKVARMLARVPFPYDRKDAEEWIAACGADEASLVYTIHRERLIGIVSVEGDGDEPELGYWLAEPWHGRGLMTEAARALVGHAFATRGIAAVRASAFVDNRASLAVQEKLGFSVTGTRQIWSRPRGEMMAALSTRLSREAFEGVPPAIVRSAA